MTFAQLRRRVAIALFGADPVEQQQLVAGLRRDLEATQGALRSMAKGANETVRRVSHLLECKREWERGDKRMMTGSRRVVDRHRRAARRKAAEAELARDPGPTSPDPENIGAGQASGGTE